jgi:hypothetical protein
VFRFDKFAFGVAKARKAKEHWGRPKAIFDRQEALGMHREEGLSSRKIAERLEVGKDSVLAALAQHSFLKEEQ